MKEGTIKNAGCDKCKWYYEQGMGRDWFKRCLSPKNIDSSEYADFIPPVEKLNKNRKCNFFEANDLSLNLRDRRRAKKVEKKNLENKFGIYL